MSSEAKSRHAGARWEEPTIVKENSWGSSVGLGMTGKGIIGILYPEVVTAPQPRAEVNNAFGVSSRREPARNRGIEVWASVHFEGEKGPLAPGAGVAERSAFDMLSAGRLWFEQTMD